MNADSLEEKKRIVQSQFSKSSEAYLSSAIHAKGKDLELLVRLAAPKGDEHLLDIATGGGHVVNAFAPYVAKVTALDLTEKMLKTAERWIVEKGHRNVAYVLGDAESLPFPPSSFDIVVCRLAAHHFPDTNRFLSEAERVLKPAGLFLLADNVAPEIDRFDRVYNDWEKKRDPGHVRALKKSEWIGAMERNGISLLELYPFRKTFDFDDWCDRMRLPFHVKEELKREISILPDEVKQYFSVEMKGDRIVSFQGESMIAKGRKGTIDVWI